MSNNTVMAMMIKSFMPMVKQNLGQIDLFIKDYLDKVEIDRENDEFTAVLMLVEGGDGLMYVGTVILSEADVIIRIVEKTTVSNFITALIENFSKK